MIMKMITLKGTIQDFFNDLLIVLRTVFNMYAEVARAQSCANHMQHIKHLSRATCYVPCATKGQLSH